MDRVEADATAAEEWQASLNATCNRLSTQYLNLLRAASSVSALEEMGGRHDPRSGGGEMKSLQDPPPPLAADSAESFLQAQLAAQNLSVACTNLVDLIRTLRLSVLLMDEDTIEAEEKLQCLQSTQQRQGESELEAELLQIKNQI